MKYWEMFDISLLCAIIICWQEGVLGFASPDQSVQSIRIWYAHTDHATIVRIINLFSPSFRTLKDAHNPASTKKEKKR